MSKPKLEDRIGKLMYGKNYDPARSTQSRFIRRFMKLVRQEKLDLVERLLQKTENIYEVNVSEDFALAVKGVSVKVLHAERDKLLQEAGKPVASEEHNGHTKPIK